MASKFALGIDFGTYHCSVGLWKQGDECSIVANQVGNRTTPSYVAFTETERIFGEAAQGQGHKNFKNTVFGVKSLLGRKFSECAAEIKELPYKILPGKADTIQVQVEYKGQNKLYTPEELAGMCIGHMKTSAEDFVGEPVKAAVIAAPADYTNTQLAALRSAATKAGLTVLRIISETAASALAFGLDNANPNLAEGETKKVIIFDVGSRGASASLLEVDSKGVFRIQAHSRDTNVGGKHFDDIVTKYFVRQFKIKNKMDMSDSTKSMQRLRVAACRAKHILSHAQKAPVEVDSIYEGCDLFASIPRARFEGMAMGLFNELLVPLQTVLTESKVAKEEIKEVMLVGGTTLMPKVEQLVTGFLGIKPTRCKVRADEIVAMGCTLQASILAAEPEGKDLKSTVPITSLSLGFEAGGGLMHVMVPKGSSVPFHAKMEFSTRSDSGVFLRVCEGERRFAADNRELGVMGLQKLESAKKAVIEVVFSIDVKGVLAVVITELMANNNRQKLSFQSSVKGLNKEGVVECISTAASAAAAEEEKYKLVSAKESLKQCIEYITQGLSDTQIEVSQEERQVMEEQSKDAVKFLETEPSEVEVITEKLKALELLCNTNLNKTTDNIADEEPELEGVSELD